MLMRVKEETAEEMAGFVSAARQSCHVPHDFPTVDLDWSSYAGKRRQLPWFLLSALLLANHGIKVLMHGTQANSPGRIYTPAALQALGIASCQSFAQAAQQLQQRNFAFVPLSALNSELQNIIDLKATLGLRSPVHSVVRMLNPASAATSIMGIFHPGYDEIHQAAGKILEDKNLAVFKGEGGETERNPDAACQVHMLKNGEILQETWPALFSSRHLKDSAMDISRLGLVWRGEITDEYAQVSAIATAAIALRALGRATDHTQAAHQATELWQQRDRSFLDKA
jgi:anthranilate phosphoribosyltransferase